jgi:hypothetical protein
MILFQLLGLALGTGLIRVLHIVRRRLTGEDKYFSFSDFLIEEKRVHSRGFLYMALPPLLGGFVMALVPGIQGITVAAAGFLAATGRSFSHRFIYSTNTCFPTGRS